MRRVGVYLVEDDTYVGPFESRGDAERFIMLMELFGEDCAGIEILHVTVEQYPHGSAAIDHRSHGDWRSMHRSC